MRTLKPAEGSSKTIVKRRNTTDNCRDVETLALAHTKYVLSQRRYRTKKF